MAKTTDKVLLLNNDTRPLDIIPWQQAARLVYKYGPKSVHQMHTRPDKELKSAHSKYEWPSVLMLKRYVDVFRYMSDTEHKQPSRAAVFKRDGYKCQYCGSTDRSKMSIDHVVPSSQGGRNTWDNLVTACFDCNSRKSDLPLQEFLDFIGKPNLELSMYKPNELILKIGNASYPEEWDTYLRSWSK